MPDKLNYQSLREELDEVLDKIQSDSVDVDEALELYEKGIELAKKLEDYLDKAQNKITKISKK
jgi:exodeoxyribonuclease VII small subunit